MSFFANSLQQENNYSVILEPPKFPISTNPEICAYLQGTLIFSWMHFQLSALTYCTKKEQ